MSQQTRKSTTIILAGSILVMFGAWSANAEKFQAKANHQASVSAEKTQFSQDAEFAQERAQSCILVVQDKPLTDGIVGYYSRKNKKGKVVLDYNRPLPNGATVCDSEGNTGKVRHIQKGNRIRPVIEDIRSLPPEEMQQILEERGLIKSEEPNESQKASVQ
jgi:hypothetical protein